MSRPETGSAETGPGETGPAAAWRDRVDATDWTAVRADLENYGCGLTGALLDPGESAAIAALYGDDARFRATVDLARYRFGAGEYRYFAEPFPAAVAGLKQALYPRLLPIAREWWARLGREAPWPDTLDEWLAQCHAAGPASAVQPRLVGRARPARRLRHPLG